MVVHDSESLSAFHNVDGDDGSGNQRKSTAGEESLISPSQRAGLTLLGLHCFKASGGDLRPTLLPGLIEWLSCLPTEVSYLYFMPFRCIFTSGTRQSQSSGFYIETLNLAIFLDTLSSFMAFRVCGVQQLQHSHPFHRLRPFASISS